MFHTTARFLLVTWCSTNAACEHAPHTPIVWLPRVATECERYKKRGMHTDRYPGVLERTGVVSAAVLRRIRKYTFVHWYPLVATVH